MRIESSSYNFPCLKINIIFHILASGSLHFKSWFSSTTTNFQQAPTSLWDAIDGVTRDAGFSGPVLVHRCCLGIIINRAFPYPPGSVLWEEEEGVKGAHL